VGVDVVDLAWVDGRVVEGDRRRPGRLPPVGPWLDHVIGIGRRAVAEDFRVGLGPPPEGRLRLLQDEQGRALAHDEPVAPLVERPGSVPCVVVVTGRQRPDDVEGAEGQRGERDLAATGDGGVDPTVAQVAERLAERDPT